jgi:6-phosphogluconolactonase (cycloisomerase 2 family)
MAITPGNTFLYVGALSGGIYLYSISANGSITLQNNSTPVAPGLVSSMKVDSTGAWLIATNASVNTTNAQIIVYSIASNTGLLTAQGNPLTVSKPGASKKMVIAPNNANVFVTLNTGGTEALTFNATTGVLSDVGNLGTLGTAFADLAVTTDPSSTYAFIAETGSGVRVLTIGTNGGLTEISGSPFATGLGPSAVLVDSTGSYVYVTNQTDSTISEFTLTPKTGTLTEVTGSPISTGSAPVDLVEDSTKTYVGVACNGGGKDLEIYSFDATTLGQLDSAGNATTGTDPTLPIAIVATR